jgi:transcriptional regulator with XRE-family HTH domain
MEDINTRIQAIITALKLSKNQFAHRINTSSAMISKVTNQKTNFGKDILEKIISAYPELNAGWLLTGVGEMWNTIEIDRPNATIEPLNDRLKTVALWILLCKEDHELDETLEAINKLSYLKIELLIFLEKLNNMIELIDKELVEYDHKKAPSKEYIGKILAKIAPLKKYRKKLESLNSLIESELVFLNLYNISLNE